MANLLWVTLDRESDWPKASCHFSTCALYFILSSYLIIVTRRDLAVWTYTKSDSTEKINRMSSLRASFYGTTRYLAHFSRQR